MNAPNKIYIDDLAVVNDCVTKISLKQLPHFSEYIRKDALVEKINKTAEIVNGIADDEYKRGCQIIIDQVTDIIELM